MRCLLSKLCVVYIAFTGISMTEASYEAEQRAALGCQVFESRAQPAVALLTHSTGGGEGELFFVHSDSLATWSCVPLQHV